MGRVITKNDRKFSKIVVANIGSQGKAVAAEIGKECPNVSCVSLQDEKEIADWSERQLSEEVMTLIAAGMDDANEEAAVIRLVTAAKKNNAFTVVITGARGNQSTEIADNSEAVISCLQSQGISKDKQHEPLYAAVRGLALLDAPEARVSLDVSDIASVMRGECQFNFGTGSTASIAAKQAMKGLSGRNCLLYFLVPEGVSLADINEAMTEAQERLGEEANILLGIKETTEKSDFVQVFAYTSCRKQF